MDLPPIPPKPDGVPVVTPKCEDCGRVLEVDAHGRFVPCACWAQTTTPLAPPVLMPARKPRDPLDDGNF